MASLLRFSVAQSSPGEDTSMPRPLPLFPLIAALAVPVQAQQPPEDAAHRADRLRTIELNERARAAVGHRDKGNEAVRESNRAAQERYERERAAWKKRVAACEGGDWSACGR